MQQIPRRVLNHSVTFYARSGVDTYNKVTYATGVNISYVRVEPVKQTSLKSLGEMKDDRMILFYDYKNSYPIGINIKALDKITYNGTDYIVRSVNDYVNHHCEVYLK